MSDEQRARQAASFDRAADVYERGRPSYPDETVDWLLDRGDTGEALRRVLDLGAGTGKLSRQIAARGVDVVAVDPSERMLEQLRQVSPDIQTVVGTAERIPLPDESVDAVLAAQAWHWVDEERAVPEVVRVLKPGGELGLVWNVRDESVPWVAELGRVVQESNGERFVREGVEPSGPFVAMSQLVVSWARPMTPDGLLDLVRSRSHFITAEPEVQDEILAGVRELLATDPELAGRDEFEMPYRTHAFRMRV